MKSTLRSDICGKRNRIAGSMNLDVSADANEPVDIRKMTHIHRKTGSQYLNLPEQFMTQIMLHFSITCYQA